MRDRRWTGGLLLALATAATGGTAIAQPIAAANFAAPGSASSLGTVRVRVDPAVGEQEAEIRQQLGALPFVQLSEPADSLITTKPDFPLDILLSKVRPVESR